MPTRQEEIEKLAALALAPLVEVAWADGAVTPGERQGVIEAARALGVDQYSEFCRSTLRRWLHEEPPTEALEAWRRLLASTLAESDSRAAQKEREPPARRSAQDRQDGRASLRRRRFLDARAGITEAEQRVLDELASALAKIVPRGLIPPSLPSPARPGICLHVLQRVVTRMSLARCFVCPSQHGATRRTRGRTRIEPGCSDARRKGRCIPWELAPSSRFSGPGTSTYAPARLSRPRSSD